MLGSSTSRIISFICNTEVTLMPVYSLSKHDEYSLIQHLLAKHSAFKPAPDLHGLKINRKQPILYQGNTFKLNFSYIVVCGEDGRTLTPYLLCPGKNRDGLKNKLLGKGSFGRVKQVERLNESGIFVPYAIKILDGSHTKKQDFQKECEFLKKLDRSHGGFSRVKLKTGAPVYYVIQDLIPGSPLGEERKWMFFQNKYQVQSAVQKNFSLQLVTALQAVVETRKLHQKGYIHADIKPENTMLDPKTGKLKLIDFGLAQEDRKTLKYAGTPIYMAPEIWAMRSNPKDRSTKVSPSVDIYSLGVMFRDDIFKGTNNPKINHLIAKMTSVNSAERPSSDEVVYALFRIFLTHKISNPNYALRTYIAYLDFVNTIKQDENILRLINLLQHIEDQGKSAEKKAVVNVLNTHKKALLGLDKESSCSLLEMTAVQVNKGVINRIIDDVIRALKRVFSTSKAGVASTHAKSEKKPLLHQYLSSIDNLIENADFNIRRPVAVKT